MQLVFATQNKHKLEEVKKMMPAHIELLGLNDIGCKEELPESGNSLQHNAIQKARYIYDKYGYSCFADDSGLEVDALDGRPGVYSARYAGPQCNAKDNIEKLLVELNHEENRKASFRTVITLILEKPDHPKLFEGIINGEITSQPRGTMGFGYDPVFIPQGFHITFAEMNPEMKNRISHRAEAIKKLVEFLNSSVAG